jgi:hypothetical protein
MAELTASQEALTRLKIYPILDELRACLCAKLNEEALCYCGLLIGEDIPLEYAGSCDDIGAAYVRISGIYPSTVAFPAADETGQNPALRAWQIYVGILRGAPYGEGLEAPDPADVAAFNLDVLGDSQILWETISCCLNGDKFEEIDPQQVRGAYTPFAVQGGVGGGEWQLTIQDW